MQCYNANTFSDCAHLTRSDHVPVPVSSPGTSSVTLLHVWPSDRHFLPAYSYRTEKHVHARAYAPVRPHACACVLRSH
eukprot:6176344-Pleurochrysis_carterae.AAC.1